jgi:hypothetical protein
MFTPVDPALDRKKGGFGMSMIELVRAKQDKWDWWEGEDNDGGHCD